MPKKIKSKTKTKKKIEPQKKAVKKKVTSKKRALTEKEKQALWQKEIDQTKKIAEEDKEIQEVRPKKKHTKFHLWLYVFVVFGIILIAWIFFMRNDVGIKENKKQESLSEIKDEFFSNFFNWEENLGELEENTEKLENTAEENIIKNPNNLNAEEIEEIEGELFPQLK